MTGDTFFPWIRSAMILLDLLLSLHIVGKYKPVALNSSHAVACLADKIVVYA